jgi:hypothetical protein
MVRSCVFATRARQWWMSRVKLGEFFLPGWQDLGEHEQPAQMLHRGGLG